MEDKRKKKLLYIMGIDWNWIFQRPQILALHLSKAYDVTIVFPRSILKPAEKKRSKNAGIKYRILWTLPFQEKNKMIGAVSAWWNRKIFHDIQEYDAVIIGYPLYFRYIPDTYSGKVIYDCMDNYEALYPDQKNAWKITIQECALATRSNAAVTTGTKLYNKIEQLAQGKVRLIRNGTDIRCQPAPFKKTCLCSQTGSEKKNYIIGYFGTIAEWFDYSLLLKSLEIFPDIEYRLLGPILRQPESFSKRLHIDGPIEHGRLAEAMQDCDCLVMPFVVDDVVQWVDPVKLYEYIALGKCIICVCYEEVKRFDRYVYFYHTHTEYMELLEHLKSERFPPKYTEEQQTKFLKENSWSDRFHKWDLLLEEVL